MNPNSWEVSCRYNKDIKLTVSRGHFATSHAHVDHYMSLTAIRTHHKMAKLSAQELAKNYMTSSPVDTIICLELTQTIGAFLAMELAQSGNRSVNENHDICVVTPEINSNSQLMFSSDVQALIQDKNILVLISTVSTGRSLNRALECITYYGGHLVGVAALFSAVEESAGIVIRSLFTPDDVPDYHSYQSNECPLCQRGRKLDGLVTMSGYTRI